MRPSFLISYIQSAQIKCYEQGGNIFVFFLHVAFPFAGRFIETTSKQCGTTGHWFAMGHYSRPVSR